MVKKSDEGIEVTQCNRRNLCFTEEQVPKDITVMRTWTVHSIHRNCHRKENNIYTLIYSCFKYTLNTTHKGIENTSIDERDE